MVRFFPLILLYAVVSCGPHVSRVTPDTQIDLSGRWNDTDSKMVADQMILDLLNSDSYKIYAKEKGRKPVIIIGSIRNKTSEHIDAGNYVKKMEYVIHNSGLAELVESDDFRPRAIRRSSEARYALNNWSVLLLQRWHNGEKKRGLI